MEETSCNSCCIKNGLKLPDNSLRIFPGDVVVLGRFSTERWKVCYGWFSYDGNRSICGWYLKSLNRKKCTYKPIQNTDMYDIYTVESH